MDRTSDVPVEVVVAAFSDKNGAENALRNLKDVRKEGLIGIENAAILWKDEKGKLHFKETADMSGGKGAAIGGVVGGVIGLVFPPSILASAALGAAVGGLSARLRDSGFPDERLRAIGEGLSPNTSALIAVIDHVWVRDIEQRLRQEAANVVTEAVRTDIAMQLEEISISAKESGEGATTGGKAPESSEASPPPTEASGGSAANPT